MRFQEYDPSRINWPRVLLVTSLAVVFLALVAAVEHAGMPFWPALSIGFIVAGLALLGLIRSDPAPLFGERSPQQLIGLILSGS